MFRSSDVVARQRGVKHICMDTLDPPTVLDTLDPPTVLDRRDNQKWNIPRIERAMIYVGASRCYIRKTRPEVVSTSGRGGI
jgi:hypothetical protein